MTRWSTSEPKQREDSYLTGDTTHLDNGVHVEFLAELIRVQEEEMRAQSQPECPIFKRQPVKRAGDGSPDREEDS